MKIRFALIPALALALTLTACAPAPDTGSDSIPTLERGTAASQTVEPPTAAVAEEQPVGREFTFENVKPMAHTEDWRPPNNDDVFEIMSPGYPADSSVDTRYVLAHALSTDHAPGNDWLAIRPYDRIRFDGDVWTVTSVIEADKSWPAGPLGDDLFAVEPDRLVMVTCLPLGPGRGDAVENIIIISHREAQ